MDESGSLTDKIASKFSEIGDGVLDVKKNNGYSLLKIAFLVSFIVLNFYLDSLHFFPASLI